MRHEHSCTPRWEDARRALLSHCKDVGAAHHVLVLSAEEPELSVDVALVGAERPTRMLVLSSGLHGVEGIFGSAVQRLLLGSLDRSWLRRHGLVVAMLHVLNPFGYRARRRVDAANVDLNRSFLLPGERYDGAPPLYGQVHRILSPDDLRSARGLWPLRLLWAARGDWPRLRQAIVEGQYTHDRGLFFGGRQPPTLQRVLGDYLEVALDGVERCLHLDLHTGLGPWARGSLAFDVPAASARFVRIARELAPFAVESAQPAGVIYPVKGGLDRWLMHRFAAKCSYDCLVAEYGTYSALHMLAALREDNCVAHDPKASDAQRARVAARMVEMFCPQAPAWRRKTLSHALALARHALQVLARAPTTRVGLHEEVAAPIE